MNSTRNLLVILILTFSGCYRGVTVSGDYAPHFTRRQIREIYEYDRSEKKNQEVIVGKIIINEDAKVGLYSYQIYSGLKSVGALYKVLKFQNKLVFHSEDDSVNIQQLNEFKSKYNSLFTHEEFQKIDASFLLGAEIIGRTL